MLVADASDEPDLGAAARFYEETLGLGRAGGEDNEAITFESGDTTINVYRSRFAGTNKATALTWAVDNVEDIVRTLKAKGYTFASQTDTEVIAHLVDHLYDGDLLDAVQRTVVQLRGAYAIAVFCRDEPHRVVGAREGSPLVLGVGTGERAGEVFLASDAMALAGVTDQICYLEEGDVVDLQLGKHWVTHRDEGGRLRERRSP